MGYDGRQKYHEAVIASGATLSAEVDLGAYFHRIVLEIPSNVTANTRIQVANCAGGTYRQVYGGYPDNEISVPSIIDIPSNITDCVVGIPASGRFMKIEATDAIENGATYFIVGID